MIRMLPNAMAWRAPARSSAILREAQRRDAGETPVPVGPSHAPTHCGPGWQPVAALGDGEGRRGEVDTLRQTTR